MKQMDWFHSAMLALLGLGCSSQPISSSDRSASASTIVTCTGDGDCQGNTFCDDAECHAVERTYGAACIIPEPDPATGKPRPVDFMCGPYICLEGRCRSCDSDAKCEGVLGAPTCAAVPDLPGRRCGDYSLGEVSTPADPPPGTSMPPGD